MNKFDKKYSLSTHLIKPEWMIANGKSCWSLTSINTYRFCNKKFKLIYIDKAPQDKSVTNAIHFIKGRFIHSIVENSIRKKFSKDPVKVEIDDINTSNLIKWKKLINSYVASIHYEEIVNKIENYDYFETEKKIAHYNKEADQKIFSGFIDLISLSKKHLLLVDWKSGKAKDLEFNQLIMYAYDAIESLIKKGYEIDSVEVRFEFIENPDHKRIMNLPVEEFLESNYHLLELYGKATTDSIKDKEWKKTDKPDKCQFCSVAVPCRQSEFKDLSSFLKKS